MNAILNKVFSMAIALILLLIFALSCAVATFIENDFGTQSAFALIYASWWFEIIQIWLCLCLVYNIYRYNLFRKEKIPSLIFHLSFIFILVGSGMTRYYGFEGNVHIREGQQQDVVDSANSYIQMNAKKGDKKYYENKSKYFSSLKSGVLSFLSNNDFTLSKDIDGKKATFKYKNLLHNAEKKVVQSKNGKPIILLMISDEHTKPAEIMLTKNEKINNKEFYMDFSNKAVEANLTKPYFHISLENGKFYFISNKDVSWFKMSDSSKGIYPKNTKTLFVNKQLYDIEGIKIVPRKMLVKGEYKWVEEVSKNGMSVLVGELNYDGESKKIELAKLKNGRESLEKIVQIKDTIFELKWGRKMFRFPFKVELIDFRLERYPGSNSPSSYSSDVRIVDEKNNVNFDYNIHMNHVLDYRGFRFFQAFYDEDELGTILSVNKDPGKAPTYFGYFLLFLGLIINILNPNSRFRKLATSINKDVMKNIAVFAFILAFSNQNLFATTSHKIDENHAKIFATLLVQNFNGRIEPIDTLARDVVNKVHGKDSFEGMEPPQIVLSMLILFEEWGNKPFIKVFHPRLKKILGMKPKAKYASINDFYTKGDKGTYKLLRYVEEAKRKKPVLRNQFDKDLIKVDERFNICYYVYSGELFRIFPKIGDKNYTWYAPTSGMKYLSQDQAKDVKKLFMAYLYSVQGATNSNKWETTNKMINYIKSYQIQYGGNIIPSAGKIKAEIFFNKIKVFKKIIPYYLLAGFILLFAIFLKMMKPTISLKWTIRIIFSIVFLVFLVHTFGLGLRWYVSGHAPWSDSYESMIYIAWALGLSGIIFARQSPISLSLTSILAGITLFSAHLSGMDPQITNLVPVLKSYWLTIHVSIITASYGFLGLCGILGFFTLLLFIIKNPKRNDSRAKEIDRNINEATKINEMSMLLGLSLLVIGNFLGGIWANESWGRYWGWDAKETWALVSILVYSVVVHLRFIPKLNNQYVFAVASSFSYWVIIMTYFGVNYYLSGMHSYAAGDPVPIPTYVPSVALIMVIVSILAFFKRNLAKKL